MQTLSRKFRIGRATLLDDPAPHLDPAEALKLFVTAYPWLDRATVGEPTVEGTHLVYEVQRATVHTKGAGLHTACRVAIAGRGTALTRVRVTFDGPVPLDEVADAARVVLAQRYTDLSAEEIEVRTDDGAVILTPWASRFSASVKGQIEVLGEPAAQPADALPKEGRP